MLDFPHKTEELLKKPSVSDARACVTLVGMEVLQQREKYVVSRCFPEKKVLRKTSPFFALCAVAAQAHSSLRRAFHQKTASLICSASRAKLPYVRSRISPPPIPPLPPPPPEFLGETLNCSKCFFLDLQAPRGGPPPLERRQRPRMARAQALLRLPLPVRKDTHRVSPIQGAQKMLVQFKKQRHVFLIVLRWISLRASGLAATLTRFSSGGGCSGSRNLSTRFGKKELNLKF